ncbi:hypothetical protein E4U42_006888 [Claviceps africana]|uniref:Uncharacterized protein n=1 Tax=Claviceps africana TaxID=83212 RepID=A0A8K0J7M4_9HYPO|nr:hypothetical protein E4U42_006888 [Claviceps africana]
MSEQMGLAEHKLQSFSSHDAYPAGIIATSLNHMQYLMFQLQRQNYQESRGTYVNPTMLILADAMLNQRFRNAAVFWEVIKGFAARALKERLLSSDEARRLLRAAGRQRHCYRLPEQVTSTYIIDNNVAEENPKMGTVKAIAEQFDDLALHEEFTTGSFEFSDDDSKK